MLDSFHANHQVAVGAFSAKKIAKSFSTNWSFQNISFSSTVQAWVANTKMYKTDIYEACRASVLCTAGLKPGLNYSFLCSAPRCA